MKSMMVEITGATNLARAYSYMPLAWSSGATLGLVLLINICGLAHSTAHHMCSPYIGGSLSKPADRFPDVFGGWDFFKTYPYFLACAIPAAYSALIWLVTYFFLKEVSVLFHVRIRLVERSHQTVHNRVPFSQLIRASFSKKRAVESIPSTPDSSSETLVGESTEESTQLEDKPLPLRALLVPRVLIAAGNSAAISLVDIAFRSVQPLFLATPIELGGLGLDPPRIGNILSIYGVLNGLFQVFCFASMNARFGTKAIYSVTLASAVPLIFTFPLLNALARTQGLSWMVWSLVGVQVVLSMVVNLGFGKTSSVHELKY